jgi:hypothetical protein
MLYTAQIQKAKVKLQLWKSSQAKMGTSVTDLLGGERLLGSSVRPASILLARRERGCLRKPLGDCDVFADIFVDFYPRWVTKLP